MEAPKVHSLSVAVIGAGLSGLVSARELAAQGHRVQLIEKSRGMGGRMATRRSESWRFDHGAQYFTVRDPRFRDRAESWMARGVVTEWDGRIVRLERGMRSSGEGTTRRFVAVPGMSSLAKHLARELDVRLETRVVSLEGDGGKWRVRSAESELGEFDAVIVSAPAPQAAELLSRSAPEMAAKAATARFAPCWAVMAGFESPLDLDFDAAFVHDSPLSWVCRNGSKAARGRAESWVLHGSPAWSEEHLELDASAAADRLLEAFRAATGGLDLSPAHVAAHRWRFALPTEPLPESCLVGGEGRLVACGDWCGGPRVEGAFLSGLAAARSLGAFHPAERER